MKFGGLGQHSDKLVSEQSSRIKVFHYMVETLLKVTLRSGASWSSCLEQMHKNFATLYLGLIPLAYRCYILYSYFMSVCSIVKSISPKCRGLPDALLHKAEGRLWYQVVIV